MLPAAAPARQDSALSPSLSLCHCPPFPPSPVPRSPVSPSPFPVPRPPSPVPSPLPTYRYSDARPDSAYPFAKRARPSPVSLCCCSLQCPTENLIHLPTLTSMSPRISSPALSSFRKQQLLVDLYVPASPALDLAAAVSDMVLAAPPFAAPAWMVSW